jgi:hypothetical protein
MLTLLRSGRPGRISSTVARSPPAVAIPTGSQTRTAQRCRNCPSIRSGSSTR